MRLIDADSINWESVEEEHGARTPAVVACQSLIQNTPTIDHVRHGKWAASRYGYFCTACKNKKPKMWGEPRYCPNCGARMDSDKK